MSPRKAWIENRLPMIVALAVITLCTALAGEARATCFTTPVKTPFSTPKAELGAAAALPAIDDAGAPSSFVGMWNTEFLLGNGPAQFDQAYQQFHTDGTENMLSKGLPPALGNICLGVWKPTGLRTIKLKHVAWNWDSDGGFAGTFVMTVMLRLDRTGNRLGGTYVADSFEPNGDVIPAAHAEGIVRGSRITVD